jgi:4-hydroxybenzoate polyprenyltransferase
VSTRLGALVRVLRPHQWAKNLLVFFPLLAAHRLFDADIVPGVLAFAALSLTASAGYVFNDLFDLASDRAHRTKRRRPFASGALPSRVGPLLIAVLLAAALLVAIRLPRSFQAVLVIYLGLTTAYTLWLKQLALVDVLTLGGLYTIRIFAGSQAARVPLSNWFLAFSMFLFLSLALVKRVTELYAHEGPDGKNQRRSYRHDDLHVLGRMGLSLGYLSILVLALYINSGDVTRFYRHPERLWFLCALLFLWVSRVWLTTERKEMHDDPVVFALRDPASYAIAALAALVLSWAT